jgi:thioredoxin reductase (NADPH)
MSKKIKIYELVIIGAGPAGLTASIYASRYLIKHLIIGAQPGGAILETHQIDNFPGIENSPGLDFAQKIIQHARKYGTEIINILAIDIQKKAGSFEIRLANGKKILAETVLIATGNKKRTLNVKGEEKFLGKGISYCATCDGFFYKNKNVAVIGGNDSALAAADYLSQITKEVCIIYRRNRFRAEPFWLNKIEKNKTIKSFFNSQVTEFLGDNLLEKLIVENDLKEKKEIKINGVFIEIGSEPDTGFIKIKIEKDNDGFIKVKNDGRTNIKGIWAAGDITNNSDKFNQVITAASEGAIAAHSIYKFLKEKNKD